MNPAANRGLCRPEPHQEQLLRATLLQGGGALQAWERWKANVDMDRLDPGSRRLLPLLYKNLRAHGVRDPLMNRFKGIYRMTWYENQMLLHKTASLLAAFRRAGIDTMLLKGAALVLCCYTDPGLRPMNDIDLLVPTDRAGEAVDLLSGLGWIPKLEPEKGFTDTFFSLGYARAFRDAGGRELDLHWHLLPECCSPDADHDFWKAASEVRIHDVRTGVLNPADQLLHVCVHGARWNPVPPLRWVSDAMAILKAAHSRMDWERLVAQARKHRLVLPLRDTLNYLRTAFHAPLPDAILHTLWSIPVSVGEEIEYKIRLQRPTLLTTLLKAWFQHARLSGKTKPVRTLLRFPAYLQQIWELDRLSALPICLVRKGVRRIRNNGLI